MIIFIVLNMHLVWFYSEVMHPEDADGMKNTVDPDQTAPIKAVQSQSEFLLRPTYLDT